MAKSFKIEDEIYLDSSSIIHNQKKLCDILYPVGSIYLSTNSTSPATLFGGTWERLKGGFLYGAVSSYGTGNLGSLTATNNHTLTVDEMPSHNHSAHFSYGTGPYNSFCEGSGNNEEWGSSTNTIATAGGGKGHSHDIPYIAVFIWRRTN